MASPSSSITLPPRLLASALTAYLSADLVPFVHGQPGIGKSAIIAQTATAMGLALRDVRTILLDPVDLRGLPYNNDGRAGWLTPDFLPRDEDPPTLLFFDELNAAPPSVQAACFQLFLDRRLGDYRLPAHCRLAAAGNLDTDGAVTHRMATPLKSRLVHLELTVDLDDFSEHAYGAGFAPEIIAFLRFHSELLHDFRKDARTFPCPRTWEFASRIMATNPPAEIAHALYAGCVGDGAASELMAFLRLFRTLPSPDAILLNPASADVPRDPATKYAIASTLARRATETNFPAVACYCERLGAEFSVFAAKTATARCPAITSTQAFTAWSIKHGRLLT